MSNTAVTYAMSNVVLDKSFLDINTMGDKGLLQEVLRLFLRQSQMLLSELRKESDMMKIAEIAHTLKGSASSVGAFRLSHAASALEKLAKTGVAVENLIDMQSRCAAVYEQMQVAESEIVALLVV